MLYTEYDTPNTSFIIEVNLSIYQVTLEKEKIPIQNVL